MASVDQTGSLADAPETQPSPDSGPDAELAALRAGLAAAEQAATAARDAQLLGRRRQQEQDVEPLR